MNSLHLLLSTVDRALSGTGKEAVPLSQDVPNAILDSIDEQIVARASLDELKNETNDEDTFYHEEGDHSLEHDEHMSLLHTMLYILFFLPNVLIYKPLKFVLYIITYPIRWCLSWFTIDHNLSEQITQEELDDLSRIAEDSEPNTDTAVSSGVNRITTISEEEQEEDLEFEMSSDGAMIADKMKSPTTNFEEQQEPLPQQQIQQRKKTKKKRQRFVFPRLLINNSFNLNNPPTNIKRKTLILDLDETLIHSLSRHNSSVFSKSKGKIIEIKLNNQLATLYYIYKRPFVDEFFNIVKNWFDLICFTASIKEYADPVINFLEEDFINNIGSKLFENNSGGRLFQKRFYRNDCIWEKGVGYIKDLSILTGESDQLPIEDTPTKNQRGRSPENDSESESSSRSSSVKPTLDKTLSKDEYIDPSRLMIIDNSPVSYSMHKENGIMIEGWINDPNDLELMNLLPLLNSLRFTSDVRAILSLKDGEASFNLR